MSGEEKRLVRVLNALEPQTGLDLTDLEEDRGGRSGDTGGLAQQGILDPGR
jgi:hypothetical protein